MLKRVVLSLIVLAGCLVHATDVEGSFLFDGVMRDYLIHIPASYNGTDSFPLVVVLHWGGGSPAEMVSFCGMNTKADEEDFIVCYPRARYIPAGFDCWNAGPCFETEIDDVGFISALIDTIGANYSIDSLRIYATGFCAGGMMIHRLACELSDKLAACAPLMGGLVVEDWSASLPERLIPLMHIHARNDPSVPYYGGFWQGVNDMYYWASIDSVMRHWVEVLGCTDGPDTFTNTEGALRQTWSRPDDSCEVIFWTTEDDNQHRWPGTYLGSQQLVANDVIWEFFSANPMPIDDPEPAVCEAQNPFILDRLQTSVSAGKVRIDFSISQRERVQICLFDASGRKTATILNEVREKGIHSIVSDGLRLSSGLYILRLQTPSRVQTGKLILVE